MSYDAAANAANESQKRIARLEAERDQYKQDYEAELDGNRQLRERFGAKNREGFTAFIERVVTENATLRAQADELEGDVDELACCEGCGGSCSKMPENNCYPPRWCHGCYQELMKRFATLRAQADRDAADAARWQWVKKNCTYADMIYEPGTGIAMADDAVDAEMARRDAGEGETDK